MNEDLHLIPEFEVLVLRSIMHSNNLSDFCKKLSLVIQDSTMTCSIRQMVNLEDCIELGTSQVSTSDKSSGYPTEIRDSVIKCLISGRPSIFFEKNSIWQLSELENPLTARGSSLLIIPSAQEGTNLTWLELKCKIKYATFPISSAEVNFLQWALAIKLNLHARDSIDHENNELDNLRSLDLLTSRQRLVVSLVRQ